MLRLQVLGAPAIRGAGGDLYLPSQKAQALLFFLAAEHDRSFSRGQIITLFWENSSEREGRNSLSTVLSRLRAALPAMPIRTEGDTLAWQALPGVSVDLHEFQNALRAAGPGAASDVARQQLERAGALYRGPLLDGLSVRDCEGFDEWLRLERERWQQRWLNALEQLIVAYEQAGQWAPAIEWARRACAADPLQERFHRALMRLHARAGDRAAALAQFRACRATLDRELGVEPDPETTALYQAILEGRVERPAPPTSPPSARLAARLDSARRRSFVGRAPELAAFARWLRADEPPFVAVHIFGPGGVGKSALLAEFARLSTAAGVKAITLDSRNIQPTPDGLLRALREATGADDPLVALPERHILLIDTYELLAPIDAWLRGQFMPQLPTRAMAVLAGRSAPAPGWRLDPGWQGMTHVIQLGNLSEAEATEYLARRNVPTDHRDAVLRFTRGYPLALALAVEILHQRPGSAFEHGTPQDIVPLLLERFVAGVPGAAHRAALEASAEARYLTEPLLAAMLERDDAHDLFEWLRGLSFVNAGPRGLLPHDLAREALVADLRWRNPAWRQELHARARRFYLAEFSRTHDHAQYLTLLDLIYLHDTPLSRSIFTWNDLADVLEDTPRQDDWPALLEMVRRHEGDESARIASGWFARQPEGVTVFRDSAGDVTGFLMFVALRPDCRDIIAGDPCAATIQRRLDARPPLPDGWHAAISRFWMDRDAYQAVSPTQGMIFVASTRYVLTTPRLAVSFHIFAEPDAWHGMMAHVLFQREPAADGTIGGRRYGVFAHDWLAQPPPHWLATLAAREVPG